MYICKYLIVCIRGPTACGLLIFVIKVYDPQFLHYCFVIFKINDTFHAHPCVFFACLSKRQVLSTLHVFLKLRRINIFFSFRPLTLSEDLYWIYLTCYTQVKFLLQIILPVCLIHAAAGVSPEPLNWSAICPRIPSI